MQTAQIVYLPVRHCVSFEMREHLHKLQMEFCYLHDQQIAESGKGTYEYAVRRQQFAISMRERIIIETKKLADNQKDSIDRLE